MHEHKKSISSSFFIKIALLLTVLVGPPALSDEVGDWFTSGDQDHRAAYTKAKTSTATETMLIYQCINIYRD